jgi:hypothetical protein
MRLAGIRAGDIVRVHDGLPYLTRPEADGEDLLPADDLKFVRAKLAVTAEGSLRTAVSRLDNARGGRMTDESFTSFMKSVRSLVDTTRFDAQLGEMERRSREHSSLKVTSEPRVYSSDSPHSYFADRAAIAEGDGAIAIAAQTRMQRYASELAYEVRRGSEEGRRVERRRAPRGRRRIVTRAVGRRAAASRSKTG